MHLKKHFEPLRRRVSEFLIGILGVFVPLWLDLYTFARGQMHSWFFKTPLNSLLHAVWTPGRASCFCNAASKSARKTIRTPSRWQNP